MMGSLTIPRQVDAYKMAEPNKGMPHQRNATTLRSRAEEGDLRALLLQLSGLMHEGIPGRLTAGEGLVILSTVDLRSKPGIHHDSAPKTDLQEWGQGWTEMPSLGVNGKPPAVVKRVDVHDAFSGHRVGLLVEFLLVPRGVEVLLLCRKHDGDDVGLEP